uniref:Glutamate-rich WD repeat-containing protein 1 n=1 Tax=Arcella intermedia TaxID=1963864 RepID=A0A6B2L2Y0_9EUKA
MASNKREREDDSFISPNKKGIANASATPAKDEQEEDLVFEDPFEDEYDEEDVILEATAEMNKFNVNDDDEDDDNPAPLQEEEKEPEKKIWNPAAEPLQPGEKLVCDNSAYEMLHYINVEWPCLSFDILSDHLGAHRTQFPHTIYMVTGTQAETDDKNSLILMKLSDMHSTKNDDKEDSDSGFEIDGPSDVDDDPVLETRNVAHKYGCINRIRSMPQHPNIISCWTSNKEVHIYDLQTHIQALDKPPSNFLREPAPIHTFRGHSTEGWSLCWSPKVAGRMASGDMNGLIHIWEPDGIDFRVDPTPYRGHTGSVEDVCFSPSEGEVFSSCSVDGMIQLWDMRKGKSPVVGIKAHETDINVMSWNQKRAFLILTGADDGTFRIWDLRKLGPELKHQFSFSWHKGPITSVEWNPNDDSELAVSSSDNTISIWDLSLTVEKTKVDGMEIPSQLLFIHQGQEQIKEVHWHKQIDGALISTASDGFNIFKPSFTDE